MPNARNDFHPDRRHTLPHDGQAGTRHHGDRDGQPAVGNVCHGHRDTIQKQT